MVVPSSLRCSSSARPVGDVVCHRRGEELPLGILKDKPHAAVQLAALPLVARVHAVHDDVARRGQQQGIRKLDERGLARAVGADNARERAVVHREVDAVQDERVGVVVGEAHLLEREGHSSSFHPLESRGSDTWTPRGERLGKPHLERRLEANGAHGIGAGKQVPGHAVVGEPAPVERKHTVCEQRILHEVRDEDDRAPLLVQPPRDADDRGTAPRVEHRARLVEHVDVGMHRHDAGKGHELLLPAGKARDLGLREPRDAETAERFLHALAHLLGGKPEVFGPEGDVVCDEGRDGLAVGVLEHHAHVRAHLIWRARSRRVVPEHAHRPRVRHEQRIHVPRERGLARAVRTDDADELAFA